MSHLSVKIKRKKKKKAIWKFVLHISFCSKANKKQQNRLRIEFCVLVSCPMKVLCVLSQNLDKIVLNCAGAAAAVYSNCRLAVWYEKENWKICQKRRHMLRTKSNIHKTQQIHVKCWLRFFIQCMKEPTTVNKTESNVRLAKVVRIVISAQCFFAWAHITLTSNRHWIFKQQTKLKRNTLTYTISYELISVCGRLMTDYFAANKHLPM